MKKVQVEYTSIWDGGNSVINTTADLNIENGKLDIVAVDAPDVEVLDEEFIDIKDERFDVKCNSDNEYFISENDLKRIYELLGIKTYKVPYQTLDLTWNNNYALVKASSKEEAYQIVEKIIKNNENIASMLSTDWEGVNTITNEVVEIEKVEIGQEYDCTVEDVEVYQDVPRCIIEATAFDIARNDIDWLYDLANEEFKKAGFEIEVFGAKLQPSSVNGEIVRYEVILNDYRIKENNIWFHKHWDHKEQKLITVEKEET